MGKQTTKTGGQPDLIRQLEERFAKNMHRHRGIRWEQVEKRLKAAPPAKLRSLEAMENTGGEPDVIGIDQESGAIIFADCAPETPSGRRSICYDPQALEERKEHKPADSALGMANAMGIEILTEEQYRALQALESLDQKTSSWILTPPEIRKLGGALFCDRRYGQVFVYHNGAQSYYAARGFRGRLLI